MFYVLTLRYIFPGGSFISPYDGFESSSLNSLLDKQFGGRGGWSSSLMPAAYSDRFNDIGLKTEDTFESYTSGSDIIGLNGGTGWSTPYSGSVSNYAGLVAFDGFEDYTSGSSIIGLISGSGWLGTFSDI